MANIILVAGTFHGGWYWEDIVTQLEALGHRVFAPTLSGLEGQPNSSRVINLDTHIQDVLNIIDSNGLAEVVLVGWSYAGMVITGVADRTTATVKGMVYIDAQVPKPGQREWDLVLEEDKAGFLAMCQDGLNMIVPAEFLAQEPRLSPHPLATKLQPLFYDQSKFDLIPKVFIFAEKWFHNPAIASPFGPIMHRVKNEPGWHVESWPHGHSLAVEAPQRVVAVIHSLAS